MQEEVEYPFWEHLTQRHQLDNFKRSCEVANARVQELPEAFTPEAIESTKFFFDTFPNLEWLISNAPDTPMAAAIRSYVRMIHIPNEMME